MEMQTVGGELSMESLDCAGEHYVKVFINAITHHLSVNAESGEVNGSLKIKEMYRGFVSHAPYVKSHC
jgi:hypothetical protein